VFQPYLEKIDETELAVQKLADNATMETIKRTALAPPDRYGERQDFVKPIF
jgi:hypothetical protein